MTPRTTTRAATPNATTDVNSDARRNDAVMTVVRVGSSWGSSRVRLAIPDLQGVFLDCLCLGKGSEGSLHVVAAKVGGVRRHDDVLIRQLAMHDVVRDDARDDQEAATNDCDDGDDPWHLDHDFTPLAVQGMHMDTTDCRADERRACRMTARNQAGPASPATADELDDGAPPGHSVRREPHGKYDPVQQEVSLVGIPAASATCCQDRVNDAHGSSAFDGHGQQVGRVQSCDFSPSLWFTVGLHTQAG